MLRYIFLRTLQFNFAEAARATAKAMGERCVRRGRLRAQGCPGCPGYEPLAIRDADLHGRFIWVEVFMVWEIPSQAGLQIHPECGAPDGARLSWVSHVMS